MRNWLAAAALSVAAAFGAVLGFGFWIQDQTGGGAIADSLFGLLAALAIAAISGLLFCWLTGVWPELPRWPPAPRATGGRVNAGHRTAEQIYYEANPHQLASCAHLQPIEQAMRRAGLKVRMLGRHAYEPAVSAECRIDEAELTRLFALSGPVYYKEQYQPERSQWDNPRADIFCAECLVNDRARSAIGVLHPDECRPDTPWFPLPPPAAPTASATASGPDSPSTRRP